MVDFQFNRKFSLAPNRGCNGFDGDARDLVSEHRVSRTDSVRDKLFQNKSERRLRFSRIGYLWQLTSRWVAIRGRSEILFRNCVVATREI